MKKLAIFLIALFYVSAFAEELPLNDVIVRSAKGIEDALPQGTMVAVLNFDSPSKAFSDFAIEELNGQLVEGGKITIVDRNNLALITEELQLQMSGAVSDEMVVSIGRQLGAHYIVTGSLSDVGTGYRFRVKVTGVEKAAVLKQISLDLKNDEKVAFLLGKTFKQEQQKPQQENVKPGSVRAERERERAEKERERQRQTSKYDESIDFTTGERWGTWALNVIPGLGSAVIMKDRNGAIINAATGGVGGLGTLFFLAFGGYSAFDQPLRGIVGASCGILWLGVGSGWNIYRSITYHHPDSRKVAATPQQGLNVAVLPDQDGNIKGYVAYRVEF